MTLKVEKRGDREIVITRVFAATRRQVFDAHTKPELLKRWLFGPAGWTMPVCEVDLRVGGRYRYFWSHVDGHQMQMAGIHREIAVPERLVITQMFKSDWSDSNWSSDENIGTIELTEHNGKTTLVNATLYPSRAARDGALETGMSAGLEAGYARVDELLATLHG